MVVLTQPIGILLLTSTVKLSASPALISITYGHILWKTVVNDAFNVQAYKVLRFNPAKPMLAPENSVVLSTMDLWDKNEGKPGYLTAVLSEQLGLPPNIVTDFGRYFGDISWSQTLRYPVAISFVPSKDIEEAAHISVTPQPDTMARIFMLFGVVDTSGQDSKWTHWAYRKLSI